MENIPLLASPYVCNCLVSEKEKWLKAAASIIIHEPMGDKTLPVGFGLPWSVRGTEQESWRVAKAEAEAVATQAEIELASTTDGSARKAIEKKVQKAHQKAGDEYNKWVCVATIPTYIESLRQAKGRL
jgi:hypothetical protein